MSTRMGEVVQRVVFVGPDPDHAFISIEVTDADDMSSVLGWFREEAKAAHRTVTYGPWIVDGREVPPQLEPVPRTADDWNEAYPVGTWLKVGTTSSDMVYVGRVLTAAKWHPALKDAAFVLAYGVEETARVAISLLRVGSVHRLTIDPDCRDGKCGSCVGGPCEHPCHA